MSFKNHTIQLPNLTNKETEAPKLIEKFKSVLAGGSNQELGSLLVRYCSPCLGLQLVQFHPHFPSFFLLVNISMYLCGYPRLGVNSVAIKVPGTHRKGPLEFGFNYKQLVISEMKC